MKFDSIVIGAGVIGLAIARKLSLEGRSTLLIEKNESFGSGNSSRNSEVIHSGIYYPKGTLKSKLCLSGYDLLTQYCESRSIAFDICGKLIIANNESEILKINRIFENGIQVGCKGLEMISEDEIKELEPNIKAKKAIHVKKTGVIDSHDLMANLEIDILNSGGIIAYKTFPQNVTFKMNRICLLLTDPENTYEIFTPHVINCAGLNSLEISSKFKGMFSKDINYEMRLSKGEYFSTNKDLEIQKLIYPVPDSQSLGIHLTRDLNNRYKFGPSHSWINEENYQVNNQSRENFLSSIKSFIKNNDDLEIFPDYAGIRPKIFKDHKQLTDFEITHQKLEKGCSLLNLHGIESPGLTSCLSIADYVNNLIYNCSNKIEL